MSTAQNESQGTDILLTSRQITLFAALFVLTIDLHLMMFVVVKFRGTPKKQEGNHATHCNSA